MTNNVIGKGLFPDHGKGSQADDSGETIVKIDQGEHGENIVLLPLSSTKEDLAIMEIGAFEKKISIIIENIIIDGIKSYLQHKAGKEDIDFSPDQELHYETRNLVNETKNIMKDMLLKATAIEDAFEHFENTVDLKSDLGDKYLFDAIAQILEPYGQVVFSVLVKNEEKLIRKRKNDGTFYDAIFKK